MARVKDEPFRDSANPQWEALVNNLKEPNTAEFLAAESVEAAALKKETITAEKLAANSVTEAKIATNAVTFGKLKPTGLPVSSGTESLAATIAAGGGAAKTTAFVYTAKAEASAKVTMAHSMGTELVQVSAYASAAKKPTEKLTDGVEAAGAISKVKITSANEIEVTLMPKAPVAKEEFFYIITG